MSEPIPTNLTDPWANDTVYYVDSVDFSSDENLLTWHPEFNRRDDPSAFRLKIKFNKKESTFKLKVSRLPDLDGADWDPLAKKFFAKAVFKQSQGVKDQYESLPLNESDIGATMPVGYGLIHAVIKLEKLNEPDPTRPGETYNSFRTILTWGKSARGSTTTSYTWRNEP